jgi:hypothetical protein
VQARTRLGRLLFALASAHVVAFPTTSQRAKGHVTVNALPAKAPPARNGDVMQAIEWNGKWIIADKGHLIDCNGLSGTRAHRNERTVLVLRYWSGNRWVLSKSQAMTFDTVAEAIGHQQDNSEGMKVNE